MLRSTAILGLLCAAGCYRLNVEPTDAAPDAEPEVERDAGPPPPLRSSCHEGTDWSGFPGCDDVRAEAHFCLGFGPGELVLLGLDSHETCAGPRVEGGDDDGPAGPSVAWIDDHLYACPDVEQSTTVFGVSLVDGSWERATTSCTAVTEWRCGLLLLPWASRHVDQYETFGAVKAGEITAAPAIGEILASRMTTQGDLLYTAWHSTDQIGVYAMPEGTPLEPIQPEGFDTWVDGLSVTEDGLLVLATNVEGTEPEVHVFEAASGAERDSFVPAIPLRGIACVVGD